MPSASPVFDQEATPADVLVGDLRESSRDGALTRVFQLAPERAAAPADDAGADDEQDGDPDEAGLDPAAAPRPTPVDEIGAACQQHQEGDREDPRPLLDQAGPRPGRGDGVRRPQADLREVEERRGADRPEQRAQVHEENEPVAVHR
jgi:hypothetical protein